MLPLSPRQLPSRIHASLWPWFAPAIVSTTLAASLSSNSSFFHYPPLCATTAKFSLKESPHSRMCCLRRSENSSRLRILACMSLCLILHTVGHASLSTHLLHSGSELIHPLNPLNLCRRSNVGCLAHFNAATFHSSSPHERVKSRAEASWNPPLG